MSRRRRSGPKPDTATTPDAPVPPPARGPASHAIEWADVLVVAFLLAMFVRVFVVELFKIPSGSMSPTLLGGVVARVDWDRDGLDDLVLQSLPPIVFQRREEPGKGVWWEPDPAPSIGTQDWNQWKRMRAVKPQFDRILVNKIAYWFHGPRRGDVVVFKPPPAVMERYPDKPAFIKRVAGLPGEKLTFDGPLTADGVRVTQPFFFEHQQYVGEVNLANDPFDKVSYAVYEPRANGVERILEVNIPADRYFLMGDHTRSSQDSRYWGAVPLNRFKGRAFFRYWPPTRMKWIR